MFQIQISVPFCSHCPLLKVGQLRLSLSSASLIPPIVVVVVTAAVVAVVVVVAVDGGATVVVEVVTAVLPKLLTALVAVVPIVPAAVVDAETKSAVFVVVKIPMQLKMYRHIMTDAAICLLMFMFLLRRRR